MFVAEVVEALNETHAGYEFTAMKGRKFTRIVKSHNGSGNCAFMFIENSSGNFLKAAGWAAPAKGPRFAPANAEEAVAIAHNSDPYGQFLYR